MKGYPGYPFSEQGVAVTSPASDGMEAAGPQVGGLKINSSTRMLRSRARILYCYNGSWHPRCRIDTLSIADRRRRTT